MSRPNILLILTDQQRPDTLGYRGLTPCRTPNIDSIAAAGTSFNNTITPCPLCLPSRAALFTGLYPTQNDMMSNQTGHLRSCGMLDHFRTSGYQVNYAGKWHMGEGNITDFTDRHAGDSTPEYSQWCRDQGLIDGWMFNDPATRTTRTPSMSIPKVHRQNLAVNKTNEAYITDFAINQIRTRDLDRPFFQVCSYNGPHPPFMIPEPYFSMYDPADVPRPTNFGPQPGEHPAHATSYYRDLFNDHGTDFELWSASYAVYWGFVTMIDDFVGQVLGTLRDEGLDDSTIVVFASDHGETLGAHGLWQKMVPFEESIRVPLIINAPGRKACASDTPASLVDIAPTLSALCDLAARADWAGRDLFVASKAPPAQFAMHQPLGDWMKVTDWRMIKQGGFKYVWHRGMAEELFDMDADPGEVTNLSDRPSHAATKQSMHAELGAFLTKTNDPLLGDWKYENRHRPFRERPDHGTDAVSDRRYD
ncbi:MAG: sulfatase-like hydrolase/transferase [Rhodobacteraceae bacterium]|nr:sulfatase-like hydrolase/transferase [Paracoccaceae bacterium]